MFNIKMEIQTPKIWKQMIKYTSNITYKARVEIREKKLPRALCVGEHLHNFLKNQTRLLNDHY